MSEVNPNTEIPTLRMFVLQLPLEQRKLFDNFVSFGSRSLLDIQQYIVEAYEIEYSLNDIAEWKQGEGNTSATVTQVNLVTNEAQGLNEKAELEYQVLQLHKQLAYLQRIINAHCNLVDPQDAEAILQRDMELAELHNQGAPSLANAFEIAPRLLNELNKLTVNLNKLKFIDDRNELMLAGADFVLKVIETAAKKLPQGREIVESLTTASWAELRDHLKKQ